MVVAVDARNVYRSHRRGTGKNLIDLYRNVATLRPGWRFLMLHEGAASDDPFAGYGNIQNRAVRVRGSRFNTWQDLAFPIAARRHGASVIHAPANTAPYYPLGRLVVTIHDLIPLEMDAQSPDTIAWVSRVRRGARCARQIITPSHWSKQQIVTHLGVQGEKVIVNYWAADTSCRKIEDPVRLAEILRRYGIAPARGYVLGFGGADPRKNTRRMIEAWARVPERVRNTHHLLLVGNQQPAWAELQQFADTLGVASTCSLHGFAEEADIAGLLSAAAALCYPSLSEGFGLPLVDAFECDTPIVTSNTTSLAEIAGDAAVRVDPTSVDDIASGLTRLLTDRPLAEDVVGRGRARRALFSWQRCAETVADALEAAAH
jgi:glycosyltransferase involved in cell wall biosynthesis